VRRSFRIEGRGKRTGLSVLSCMRKNSGSSLVMKGKALEVRNSEILPQIQVRTDGGRTVNIARKGGKEGGGEAAHWSCTPCRTPAYVPPSTLRACDRTRQCGLRTVHRLQRETERCRRRAEHPLGTPQRSRTTGEGEARKGRGGCRRLQERKTISAGFSEKEEGDSPAPRTSW
jgi:hypothetical protein